MTLRPLTWLFAVWALLAAAGWIPNSTWAAENSYFDDPEPAAQTTYPTSVLNHDAGSDEGDDCDCCKPKLLGFIQSSEPSFGCFISPMTNPVFFEDPRTLSEVRFIFMNHVIPTRTPLAGGDVQLLAAQVRAALTDRLSIVAAKDGFIFTGADPLIIDDGWADVSLGLKYNLYSDPDSQRLLSAGFAYEFPWGSRKALQGNGDGEVHLYLTGGTAFGAYGHWVSAAGLRLPVDSAEESQSVYWSNHWDWRIRNSNFYALGEINWYHWTQSGKGGVAGIEGLDVINLGSTGVAGNDIVTGAFGFKYRPSFYREFGIAWEKPLTDRQDILDNRLTIDVILRY